MKKLDNPRGQKIERTEQMKTLQESDKHFADRGATHYHDHIEYFGYGAEVICRHYFNENGEEIGLFHPLIDDGLMYFDPPRVWGIDKNLQKI